MRQIRKNVFETNSSSTHSITMCMKSDYDKWVSGELVWNRWGDRLVEITPDAIRLRKKILSEKERYRYLY